MGCMEKSWQSRDRINRNSIRFERKIQFDMRKKTAAATRGAPHIVSPQISRCGPRDKKLTRRAGSRQHHRGGQNSAFKAIGPAASRLPGIVGDIKIFALQAVRSPLPLFIHSYHQNRRTTRWLELSSSLMMNNLYCFPGHRAAKHCFWGNRKKATLRSLGQGTARRQWKIPGPQRHWLVCFQGEAHRED